MSFTRALACAAVTASLLVACEDDVLPPGFSLNLDAGTVTLPDGAVVKFDAGLLDSGRPVDPIPDASADAPPDAPGPIDSGTDAPVPVDSGPPPDAGGCVGRPNGSSCGDTRTSACDLGDTCQNGVCVENHVPEGSACGSAVATACSEPDTCDGLGQCSARNKPAGTACGSSTASTCTQPDTCDGNGTCLANNVVDGTACGDPGASQCDSADSCIAGVCVTNVQPNGTPCGNATADECTAADSCLGGVCVANNVPDDSACGDPTATACNGADTCQVGVCVPNLANDGTTCGDPTVTACNAADSCLAGACVPNLAVDGTPCGDPATTSCSGPDACLAGACSPNNAIAGTPCGSNLTTDCSGADTCDGVGVCQANHVAAGGTCYDCASGPGLCSSCNASGACNESNACTLTTLAGSPPTGGNQQRGNMFDVTTTNRVIISSFDQVLNVPAGTTTTYEIYWHFGTHVGVEQNAGAWRKLVGPVTITSQGETAYTRIALPTPFVLRGDQTYSFYLTNTNTSTNRYHDGTEVGQTAAADANLTIREGVGKDYPFTTTFSPRVWEGRINYWVGVRNETGDEGRDHVVDGIMFDVSTTTERRIQLIDVQMNDGTGTIEVYFKRGTHVGFEAQSQAWELLGGGTYTNDNEGSYVRVPFSVETHLPAGSTGAFYIRTNGGSPIWANTGTAVGSPVDTVDGFTIHQGVTVVGNFGATSGPRDFLGVFEVANCP